MNAYGGIDKAKKDILHDFFTHAFDGSGGDNFFDAGYYCKYIHTFYLIS